MVYDVAMKLTADSRVRVDVLQGLEIVWVKALVVVYDVAPRDL
jgi:hypothetical protein